MAEEYYLKKKLWYFKAFLPKKEALQIFLGFLWHLKGH